MPKVLRRFALLLALAAFAHIAVAAPIPVPKVELEAAEVMAVAKGVTPKSYPNSDDVLVDDLIRVRYEKDGTSVTADDTWLKVLTEKGKKDHTTLGFHFNAHYGSIEVVVLEIHKPDGKVVPIDIKAQSKVMVNRSQMSKNIFDPNQKRLQVGVPGLEVGDVLHYRFIRRSLKTRMPNTWSNYEVLEYTSPMKRYVIEVDGPKELPLRAITLKDEIKGKVTHTRKTGGDRIIHRWEIRDVARMYKEPRMPALHTVVQRLLLSTIPDWRDISKWYWDISKPHLEPTDGMKTKVAELTKGMTDRRKKVEAIFQFVSQKIRYMGITTETEAPGYEPHDVKITFENKYGVCRDKAALLVAMLRIAGYEAYPVLINNGAKKDIDVPQPYFNHAITAVKEPDGSYLLMDSTDETTRRLLPSYLSNMSYLVAHPNGEPLKTSPIVPAEENMMRIVSKGKVDVDGNLTLECVMGFEGINDNAYRGYFSRIRPVEQRRFFAGVARRVVAGGRLVKFKMLPANLRDMTKPLSIRMTIEAKAIAISDGKTLMLPVPAVGANVGIVNFRLRSATLEKRNYPFVTGSACGVEESLELDVSELVGKTIILPKYESVETDAITFRRTLERSGGVLTGRSAFLLKTVEFTPAQYVVLKDTLKKMELNRRKRPIFEGKPAIAKGRDVEVLQERVDYELTDPHTWSELHRMSKRVLSYAGKKAHSELRINYNPVWEEVAFTGSVTSAKGEVKKVRKEEMNTLDAAWAASAPRYPAGKTLVISFPNVDIGSVIKYEYTITRKNQPFFSVREYFNGFDLIHYKWVNLGIPAGYQKILKTEASEGINRSVAGMPKIDKALFYPDKADAGQIKEKQDRPNTAWFSGSLPTVKRERNLPPWWSFNPTLYITTSTWPEYAKRVGGALGKAADGHPDIKALAQKLIAGKKEPADQVCAIRDYVARSIRHAGPSITRLPLSAITPAHMTLKDGYGNGADRAVLIYALLVAAGHKAEFVLASSVPEAEGLTYPMHKYPRAGDFPMVLVRTKIGQKDIYLNDTNEYARLGVTPHDGLYGLAIPSGVINIIRAADSERDRAASTTDIKLLANGDAHITTTVRHYGSDYTDFRKKFSEIRPEERRRHHQKLVASIAQSAKAAGPFTTDYKAYPGVEGFAVTVKNYAVHDGDHYYFTVRSSLGGIFGLSADTRENPLYRSWPTRARATTNITLPLGVEAIVLKPDVMKAAVPSGHVSSVLITAPASEAGRPLRLILFQEAILKPAVISSDFYSRLLKLQRQLRHPKARTILLKMKKGMPLIGHEDTAKPK
jgi:transglutaminase-like putative cysteine protease